MTLNRRGIIGTVIVHNIIVLLFILFGFKVIIPFPGNEGIVINFGDSETGFGKEEPMLMKKEQSESATRQTAAESSPANGQSYMTQDMEEAPAVVSSPPKAVKETKKQESVVPKTNNTQITVKKEEEKPSVNTKALYGGKKQNSESTSSQGITSDGGNQGGVDGSENSDNYLPSLGNGEGISFDLTGRNPLALPKPEYDYQKEGKVVVEITVDREGNVVNANAGVKGSTTLDNYLLGVAKKAALKARFDGKSNAPAFQKGTITYHFKLR